MSLRGTTGRHFFVVALDVTVFGSEGKVKKKSFIIFDELGFFVLDLFAVPTKSSV